MSQNRTFNFKLTGLMLGAFMLVVIAAAQLTYAVGERLCGCGPTTPCACAADGICRPKRETWGHYHTRWRTWPGEVIERPPSQTGEPDAADDQVVDPLDGYETPKPEQEDLRAPPKAKRERAVEEAAPVELPGAEPAPLLPGPEEAPAEEDPIDFDPFSELPELPQMEDAPPALPPSLRQAAIAISKAKVANARPQRTRRTQPRVAMNITPEMLTQPVRQVSWQQQQSSMPQVNPASAVQTSAAQQPLQQAIYYEASDK